MAKTRTTGTTPEDKLDKLENFVNENQNKVLTGVAVVLLVVFGYLGFNNYYLPKQEQEAQEQMFKAQFYFEVDSFSLALNGDGNYPGFLDIIDSYRFTKASNLSNYYAGISYLKLGKYDLAIDYLNKFSADDVMLSAIALGAIGDAYAEKGENGQSLNYYVKAAKASDNNFTAPLFYLKAGLMAESEGKNADALSYFKALKENYPESSQASNAEKHIARLSMKS
ncbi:MAG: tetratricopeptide repeat protein [Chitinophagales bacterium]